MTAAQCVMPSLALISTQDLIRPSGKWKSSLRHSSGVRVASTPWSGVCWRKLLTMEKREISAVRAIGNGAWASLAIEPASCLHGKQALLAAARG